MLTLGVSHSTSNRPYSAVIPKAREPATQGGISMDKDTTPSEPRLDEDLAVEDESAEQVTGGHTKPAHTAPSPHEAGTHSSAIHK